MRPGDCESVAASKRTGDARSEMKNPLTASAGHVAHQPTTPEVSPFAEATFQIAGPVRERPETGRDDPVATSNSWKSTTPCSGGVRPVAIVVQRSGEARGRYVSSRACAPFSRRDFRCGSRPDASSGSRRLQSAPSQPTTMTRGGRAAEGAGFAACAGDAAAVRSRAPQRREKARLMAKKKGKPFGFPSSLTGKEL